MDTENLLAELNMEISYADGCRSANVRYEPSADIVDLLKAARDEIETLRSKAAATPKIKVKE